MKKRKLMLGVLALVFAVASAFASRSVLDPPGYERIPATGTTTQCLNRGNCDNAVDAPVCKFRVEGSSSTVDLHAVNDITISCGGLLRHSQDGGVINPPQGF